MGVSVTPGAKLYDNGELIGETGRVRAFPVFPAHGDLCEAVEILQRGFGVGIDFSMISTSPTTFFVPAGNYRPMTARLMDWDPIYLPRLAPIALNGGSYPAPSKFCGRQGHVSKIHRAGLPPLHPTKGYRRKPKGFRGGRR